MYPDVDHAIVHQLVVNDTFSKFQLLVNDSSRVVKPFNTILLERGGWQLFIFYYGILFVIFWLSAYFILKPFFKKEEKKEKL